MRILQSNPITVWFTGLPASGKSTLATALNLSFEAAGCVSFVLDGDILRCGLNRDLGYSAKDRHENIRRIAEVSRLFNSAGVIVIAALISPYCSDRLEAKEIIGHAHFLEVYLNAPLEVCEARDPKGHYRKARAGEIPDFTGISAPYEVPETPDLVLDTWHRGVEECVRSLLKAIELRTQLRALGS